MKRSLKSLFGHLLDKYFILKPYRGLKLLYWLGLDIAFFTLPLFRHYNRESFHRLRALRARGKNPSIILWVVETDARFSRLPALTQNREDMVLFAFHKHLVGIENFIFGQNGISCGFYEDARMKYIAPENDPFREKYRVYLRKLFPKFEKMLGKIDFFLSGSNNDRYVVELITVAQERGISCVVCEREGTGTDYTYKGEGVCFKNSKSIQAHYIFCANDQHRDMFDFAKLPSVREVRTLGEIDTDLWFHRSRETHPSLQKWNHFRKKVLYLTFGLRNYIEPYLYPMYPNMDWSQLRQDSEDVLIEFAQRNPDVLVFYRMGHMEDYNKAFMTRYQELGLKNIVTSDRSFPCEELMLYCDIIIGFQTTAMFEAMFTEKPLVQLFWHIPSVLDPETQLLPIAKFQACHLADSKEKFGEILQKFAKGEPSLSKLSATDLENRKKTREIMFYKADGKVSERFIDELTRLISIRARNA